MRLCRYGVACAESMVPAACGPANGVVVVGDVVVARI